ncbi:hypothetical protein D9Q98_001816 [Chlorella vulgaris]|uniref:tRNA-binding domain-containing protein n=1 Tax=Chlorella vulgaris TaxID=3077 RepID=A0A9D4TV98_CHLVU|nr:hypothetical protein D9Q98_001816 [Chlorella vulgaris]
MAALACCRTLGTAAVKLQPGMRSSTRTAWAPCPTQRQLVAAAADSYRQRRSVVLSAAETEAAAPAAAASVPDVTKVDLRVGRIVSCEKHPDADALYVEQIDVGEAEGPRTIVSGLVKYVPLEEMQDRSVVIIANLKPRNMRGVKSNGMVLCASNAEHTEVEPLSPPEGAAVGERVWFGDNAEQGEPAKPNQVDKKKMWEEVQPLLRTDDALVAGFNGSPMMTSGGPVTVASLGGASIS